MAGYTTQNIRNIALLGHAGAGKTQLAEALLHHAGVVKQPGSVERGNMVCDFDPLERAMAHSLRSAICHCEIEGTHVNLIDTPGYPDLFGRAVSVLPAVETAAIVINAQAGVESVALRALEAARERHLCRLIVVNRIDCDDADCAGVLAGIQEQFGDQCLPLNLPADRGQAVVDCFFAPTATVTDIGSVEEAHTRMIEQVVEVDDELMEIYLEQGQELSPEQLHDPFEKALRDGHLIPVCFVSAKTGAGIPQLAEVLCRLMPHPGEGNPPEFLVGEGPEAKPVEVVPDPEKHVVAHVFKVNVDPFMGKVGVFRIHQGTITGGTQLFIGDGRKPFKVNHLLRLQGKNHEEVPQGVPGDICAVAKVDDVHLDAVLHDSHDEDYFHLRPLELPPPMMGLAVEPIRHGDEQKISDALGKLAEEDPSMTVEHNPSANEMVIRGMGDLHLRVILEELKERYNVEVNTRPPSIAYRETILQSADGRHRHKKQTGGAGQFGEVFLKVEPLERGEGFEFCDRVVGGAIPNQFIPAVEKGVRQAMESGAVAGFPLQDIRVTVYDGKYHPVDSKEVAFVTAGKKAFLDAVRKAKPVILEPIVNIEITAPQEKMGDISGDLSSRRGRVSNSISEAGGKVRITAQVPLAELDNYQSSLQSMTGGEGVFTLEFSHYEPVPAQTQKELMAAYQHRGEE